MLILVLMTVCNKNAAVSDDVLKISGSWAYNHDKNTPVTVFEKTALRNMKIRPIPLNVTVSLLL